MSHFQEYEKVNDFVNTPFNGLFIIFWRDASWESIKPTLSELEMPWFMFGLQLS